MATLTPVILAGGSGTRLWPLSREHYPKQFLAIAGERSLLQETALRLTGLTGSPTSNPCTVAAPYLVCNEEHRFLVAEQIRAVGEKPRTILLEPVGRNTAPALTVAALASMQDGTDTILIMMPADHVLTDVPRFVDAVRAGIPHAEQGDVVVFGIVPDRAETGFGYIAMGAPLSATDESPARWIESFVEKPSEETARRYVSSGRYLWNSGMFMMKASVWLDLIKRWRPDIRAACDDAYSRARVDGDFTRLDKEAFSGCPADSIDYAVMEKMGGQSDTPAVVVPLAAGWSDVGAWSSLWEVNPHDAQGNAVRGDVCALDTRNSVITSEHRLVAAVGCEDMVIVETADAVMVAPKSRAQDVKRVVEWLKANGREERLTHRRVYRPWGSYEAVDAGPRFQVKRIMVKPGGKLSLQMHHHRAEHWIVVKGTARVTRGEEVFLITENQSTYIPLGVQHRLENPGTIPLEIIEVQSGAYLGENDIVRFEDAYNRT